MHEAPWQVINVDPIQLVGEDVETVSREKTGVRSLGKTYLVMLTLAVKAAAAVGKVSLGAHTTLDSIGPSGIGDVSKFPTEPCIEI